MFKLSFRLVLRFLFEDSLPEAILGFPSFETIDCFDAAPFEVLQLLNVDGAFVGGLFSNGWKTKLP